MVERVTCPICREFEGVRPPSSEKPDTVGVKCPRCGEFWVTGTLAAILANGGHATIRHVLSAVTREHSDRGSPLVVRSDDVERLVAGAAATEDPLALADRFLGLMAKRASGFSGLVGVHAKTDYPLVFGRSPEDLIYLLKHLRNEGLIEPVGENKGYRITPGGWRQVQTTRSGSRPTQAFVAMSFDRSMDDAWEHGFIPGLRDAGYDAIRVDKIHHNEKICDRILAEVRRSGLVIADFTGQRAGVYFEAGFALGIGRPVIWTCRSVDVGSLHFDTRQFNHILWDSPDDLREQLSQRIVALVPVVA